MSVFLAKFKQLLMMEISPGRFIVLSKKSDDTFYLSQKIVVKDDKQLTTSFFLKNSLIFNNKEVFEEFRKKLLEIDINKPVDDVSYSFDSENKKVKKNK